MPGLTRDCIALSRGVGILNRILLPYFAELVLFRIVSRMDVFLESSFLLPEDEEGNRLDSYATRGFIS